MTQKACRAKAHPISLHHCYNLDVSRELKDICLMEMFRMLSILSYDRSLRRKCKTVVKRKLQCLREWRIKCLPSFGKCYQCPFSVREITREISEAHILLSLIDVLIMSFTYHSFSIPRLSNSPPVALLSLPHHLAGQYQDSASRGWLVWS